MLRPRSRQYSECASWVSPRPGFLGSSPPLTPPSYRLTTLTQPAGPRNPRETDALWRRGLLPDGLTKSLTASLVLQGTVPARVPDAHAWATPAHARGPVAKTAPIRPPYAAACLQPPVHDQAPGPCMGVRGSGTASRL
ncbi:hypothetical protein GCM10010302_10520 [Streptomyces polychromogenes]|uniref:Uncharacterized protein n=1 Tax=Streptomyces polychromogenes TaxID=67342 RepID=A0ABP3EUE2_9ACTN